jgi:hypothetical protein
MFGPYPGSIDLHVQLTKSLKLGTEAAAPMEASIAFDRKVDVNPKTRMWVITITDLMRTVRDIVATHSEFQKLSKNTPPEGLELVCKLAGFPYPVQSDQEFFDNLRARLRSGDLNARIAPLLGIHEPFPTTESINSFINSSVQLPPLTKATANQWSRAIRNFLMSIYQGHPEQMSELRSIGEQRGKKNDAEPGSKTAESNIRDAIFERFKATLRNLLRDDSI